MPRRLWTVLILAPLALLSAEETETPLADAPGRVAEILGRMGEANPETVWPQALALEGLGKGAVEALTAALQDAHEAVRLASAKALCALGANQGPACEALADLARKGSPAARAVAVHILGECGGPPAVKPLSALLEEDSLPVRQRLAVARALWGNSRHMKAPAACRTALEDPDPGVRNAAALALGEMGQMADARIPLEALALAPTDDGEKARGILLKDRLSRMLAGQEGKGRKETADGLALLDEVAGLTREYYVDDTKTDSEALFEAAARGLASSLDPHSTYLGRSEVEHWNRRMEGHYAGIGIVVSRENGALFVQSTFFEGPAYKAGIRSGDAITKISGKALVDESLDDSVRRLKGEPGTDVTIDVVHRGMTQAVPVTLKRAEIATRSVHSAMLPGKVGYIRMSEFVMQSAQETKDALEALRKDGMRSLILDLRFNPGGLLLAAVQTADLFLKPGLLVVYSEGRNPEVAPRQDYYTGGKLNDRGSWVNPPPGASGSARGDYPLVVLVNQDSASASEILSGALRDHSRAVLVGQKTFGKGSVQLPMRLKTTSEKTMLKITIAKYYLPSGRCIHGIGVEPDIAVAFEDVAGWKFEEYRKLVDAKAFEKYLADHPVEGHDDMLALADNDGGDWTKYPGFEAWHEALKTSLSKDDLRTHLRRLLRDRAAEARGKEYVTDLAADVQLQRAALEALRRSGTDPKDEPAYAPFAGKFPEKETPPSN